MKCVVLEIGVGNGSAVYPRGVHLAEGVELYVRTNIGWHINIGSKNYNSILSTIGYLECH